MQQTGYGHASPSNSQCRRSSKSSTASASEFADPKKAQTAARAVKRQRGRERRKFFKALEVTNKTLEEEAQTSGMQDDMSSVCSRTSSSCSTHASSKDTQVSDFQARAEAVATERKLVLKNTFFDVEESAESSFEEEAIVLPEAFFKTTIEIDDWRRDYRRFRLGHHQGAKGEVNQKDFSMDTLSGLDLRGCVDEA